MDDVTMWGDAAECIEGTVRAIGFAEQALEVLLKASGRELARIGVVEETPTEGQLPQQGVHRSVSAVEVIGRAMQYLGEAKEDAERVQSSMDRGVAG